MEMMQFRNNTTDNITRTSTNYKANSKNNNNVNKKIMIQN